MEPMPSPSLLDRLKGARIVQVLLVYLGAAWVVLQITETLIGLLDLPEWVGPVAVLLMAVGLFVVLATAWVQALPQTTAREEAGEVPTDWEVDAGDMWASLRAGRLPHLTWGRAIVGGVVALSLLFGVGGLYVLATGGTPRLGPAEAGARDVSSGIAVLPFHATGPSLELYREGMVDLVSANLDGLSGYRAVDSRTVLARWNRDVGGDGAAELDDALRVAAGTGARYAVMGSGVEVGNQIRFTADIYDLDTREKVGDGQVEGSPENVLALVDALTVDLMRSLLEATGQGSAAQEFRLASILTESVPALRAYLEGDAAFRRASFEEAREHLERAVLEDSTFALAHWRLGDTYGWTEGIGSDRTDYHRERAANYADRLPPREATILELTLAVTRGEAMGRLDDFERYIDRYPDDPDGWYLLGEVGLHDIGLPGVTDERLEEALYRTVELDPTFGPYYTHALDWATASGDSLEAMELLAGLEETGAPEARLDLFRIRADLFLGDDATRGAALARLDELDRDEVNTLVTSAPEITDHGLPVLEAVRRHRIARGWAGPQTVFTTLGQQGKYAAWAEELDGIEDPMDRLQGRTQRLFTMAQDWGVVDRPAARALLDSLGALSPRPRERFNVGLSQVNLATLLADRAGFEEGLALSRPWPRPAIAGLGPDTTRTLAFLDDFFELHWLVAQGRPQEAFDRMQEHEDFLGHPAFLGFSAGLAYELEDWDAVERFDGAMLRLFNGRSQALWHLGQAAEARGDVEGALERYRTLLLRMRGADTELPALEHARAYVARHGEG